MMNKYIFQLMKDNFLLFDMKEKNNILVFFRSISLQHPLIIISGMIPFLATIYALYSLLSHSELGFNHLYYFIRNAELIFLTTIIFIGISYQPNINKTIEARNQIFAHYSKGHKEKISIITLFSAKQLRTFIFFWQAIIYLWGIISFLHVLEAFLNFNLEHSQPVTIFKSYILNTLDTIYIVLLLGCFYALDSSRIDLRRSKILDRKFTIGVFYMLLLSIIGLVLLLDNDIIPSSISAIYNVIPGAIICVITILLVNRLKEILPIKSTKLLVFLYLWGALYIIYPIIIYTFNFVNHENLIIGFSSEFILNLNSFFLLFALIFKATFHFLIYYSIKSHKFLINLIFNHITEANKNLYNKEMDEVFKEEIDIK